MTSVIMVFIKYVLRIPLRMSEEQLLVGDDAIHVQPSLLHGDTVRRPINGDGELGIIQGESLNTSDNGKTELAK